MIAILMMVEYIMQMLAEIIYAIVGACAIIHTNIYSEWWHLGRRYLRGRGSSTSKAKADGDRSGNLSSQLHFLA